MRNELPPTFEREIMDYIDESNPTPKEVLLSRLLENAWHKPNFRTVINYVFSIPANLFFKDGDHVRFA